MSWRIVYPTRQGCLTGVLTLLLTGAAPCQEVADRGGNERPAVGPASVQYLPPDALPEVSAAAPGIAPAVMVQGVPLIHTRQLWPLDGRGECVGAGALEEQITQLLDNLEAVLHAAGSSLDQLVRLNVYALSTDAVARLRERLDERLGADVRPAMTAILTPLRFPQAQLAVDAVAAGLTPTAGPSESVAYYRCDAVWDGADCADAARLPVGGVAYLSGVPAEGGLTQSAVSRSVDGLRDLLEPLQLSLGDVVQLKIFLRPATAAEEVTAELQRVWEAASLPPLVFAEWLASAPVEMELVVRVPPAGDSRPRLEFFTPPGTRPVPTFSRAVVSRTGRLIYFSGTYARQAGSGEAQAVDVFQQLQQVLDQAGGGGWQMAKVTYYVSDDDAARGLDRARPRFLHVERPPAASKVMVHAVGKPQRTLAIDLIGVHTGPHE